MRDTMNCTQFKHWLQEKLDSKEDGLPLDAQAHVDLCPDCQSWQEAAHRLESGLRLLPVLTPSRMLSGRIVAMVLSQNRARRRRRQLVWAGLALAASVLLFSIAALFWRAAHERNPHGPVPQVGASSSAPGVDSDASSNAAPHNVSRFLGDLLTFGLFPGTQRNGERNRFITAMQTVLDLVSPMSPEGVGSKSSGDPSQQLTDAGQSVQTGFKPVTGSARRAVDLFMREVPSIAPENR